VRHASLSLAFVLMAFGVEGPVLAQTATSSDASAAGSDASAPQGPVLKEVIVTAQKRTQNAQDVPIALTALSGSRLADQGITDTEALTASVPGVTYSEPGGVPGATQIFIRGIGNLDYGAQEESPNALYIDGAYLSFQGATGLGLFDVNQVTVLRGPQGTLFGRNATGGLVQIETNKPTDYFTGYLESGYGSYNEYKVDGALSGPLSSDVDARFAFLYHDNDGYIHNTLGPSGGADKSLSARFQLQYKANQNTQDLVEMFVNRVFPITGAEYEPFPEAPNPGDHGLNEVTAGPLFAQNCANLGLPAPAGGFPPGVYNCLGETQPAGQHWQVQDPYTGFFNRWVAGATNSFTDQMSWTKLTAITNYTYYNEHYVEDDSLGPIALIASTYNSNAYQISQELRLTGETQRLHWQTGAYYLTTAGHYNTIYFYGGLVPSPYITSGPEMRQDVYSYALFNQDEYELTRRWGITVGERVGEDRKRADIATFCEPDPATCSAYGLSPTNQFIAGTLANVEWSGNLQLTYKPSQAVMLYAGVRRGTKGAEVLQPASPQPGLTFQSVAVKPEVLTDYEAGFKSTLFGNRLRLNGDGYYYRYSDYQAFKFVGITAVLFNAQARDYGSDLSATALLTPSLTAEFSIAYMHTKVLGVTLPDGTVDDDAQQPFAPKVSLNADLRKEWHEPFGSLFVEAGLTYAGQRYLSTLNENSVLAPSYTTANASVGYTSPNGKWTSSLSADNINNAAIEIDAFDLASTAGYGVRNFAPPRWVRWQLAYHFD
jgi:iron complex outermembrane recepter protein